MEKIGSITRPPYKSKTFLFASHKNIFSLVSHSMASQQQTNMKYDFVDITVVKVLVSEVKGLGVL